MLAPVINGGLAGLLATAPMTAVMKLLHRQLPRHERQYLPPRQITMRLARWAKVAQHLDDEKEQKAATYVSHFGYGTTVGSLYGLACASGMRPGVGSGLVYGMLVWAGSYLGLLPALGILSPATRHPPRRTLLMIAAHLVWGSTLGLLMSWLQPSRSK